MNMIHSKVLIECAISLISSLSGDFCGHHNQLSFFTSWLPHCALFSYASFWHHQNVFVVHSFSTLHSDITKMSLLCTLFPHFILTSPKCPCCALFFNTSFWHHQSVFVVHSFPTLHSDITKVSLLCTLFPHFILRERRRKCRREEAGERLSGEGGCQQRAVKLCGRHSLKGRCHEVVSPPENYVYVWRTATKTSCADLLEHTSPCQRSWQWHHATDDTLLLNIRVVDHRVASPWLSLVV